MAYPDNPMFRGRGAAHAGYMLHNVSSSQDLPMRGPRQEPLMIDRETKKDAYNHLVALLRKCLNQNKEDFPNYY